MEAFLPSSYQGWGGVALVVRSASLNLDSLSAVLWGSVSVSIQSRYT